MLKRQIQDRLDTRAARGELRIIEDYAKQDKTDYVDWASNDYLAFAVNEEYGKLYIERLKELGRPALGSTGSRTASGNSPQHIALEQRLAAFHGSEAALLFNSGFDANASLWKLMPQADDIVLFDELIHASIHQGLKQSRARIRIPFTHNSVDSLYQKLADLTNQVAKVRDGKVNVFLAIETLYSMDGDFAPLEEMIETFNGLLPAENGYIIVDEAHSTGLYGEQGRGYVSQLGLESSIFARVHTFGKAVGSNGAVVLCPAIVRTYLTNYAESFRFSTAMPYSNLVALQLSYDFQESQARLKAAQHVFALSKFLQYALSGAGFELLLPNLGLETPIIPLKMPNPRPVAAFLRSCHRLAIVPLTFPNVPRGTERLRICVHANNTYEEAKYLVDAICAWRVQCPPEINGKL